MENLMEAVKNLTEGIGVTKNRLSGLLTAWRRGELAAGRLELGLEVMVTSLSVLYEWGLNIQKGNK